MNHRFDVVVVGGGPAGSAAAHVLAAKGMNVAIVDKATFPRDKLCGGLLSQRSETIFKSIFGDVWGPGIETVSHGVVFYDKDRFLNRLDSYRTVYFTSRLHYDAYLLDLASKKGATIFQGTAVSSIDPRNHAVSLADGRQLCADFVIGADGVNSRISKLLGFSRAARRKLAFGLESEIPRDFVKRAVDSPEIYFGIARWGYGWVFPKQKSIMVGLAGRLTENRHLRLDFEQFLRQVCGYVPNTPLKGHHLPFGNFLKTPGRSEILLVGDAAGLVEPVTGEGIAFAMLSGKYAAEAVTKAAAAGHPGRALEFYLHGYRSITSLLRQAKWMRCLIFPELPQRLFLNVLSRSQSVIKGYLDLLAGEIDYTGYCWLMAKIFTRHSLVLTKLRSKSQ